MKRPFLVSSREKGKRGTEGRGGVPQEVTGMEMAAVVGVAVVTSRRHLFSKVEGRVWVPSRPLSSEVECGAMLGPQKGSLKTRPSQVSPVTGPGLHTSPRMKLVLTQTEERGRPIYVRIGWAG